MNEKDFFLAVEPTAPAEMFGAWEPWSGCTMECLGIKRRTRTIAVQGKVRSAGTWAVRPGTAEGFRCWFNRWLMRLD